MDNQIAVLNDGFVRLDAAEADDLSVVNSARVSFAQKSEYLVEEFWEGYEFEVFPKRVYILSDKDEGLIKFLMRDRHGTPFEHNMFRFHIRCPIFVAREWMRHRIGSFNEMSGRYTKLQKSFYYPEHAYTQVGKPGAYTFEPMGEAADDNMRHLMLEAYEVAWMNYEIMLKNGVAKELARSVLPVGIYTEFYWTVNARSLMNFISLRSAPTAQAAIRECSDACLAHFTNQMPVTAEAFIAGGMIAP